MKAQQNRTDNFNLLTNATAFAELAGETTPRPDGGGKRYRYPLTRQRLTADAANYASKIPDISFRVETRTVGNSCALIFKATYRPHDLGDTWAQNHFDPECAVGIHIPALEDVTEMVAVYRRCEYWVHPFFGSTLSDLPQNTQAILGKRTDGRYIFLTTVCGDVYKSVIAGGNAGMELYIRSNDYRNTADTVALVYGVGDDPYTLPEQVTADAFRALGKRPLMRRDRAYPPILEYLGWCSWDAFQMYVTHDGLVAKTEEFRKKRIPVRWMLLDDMWGDVPNNNVATMHSRELDNFEAAPERFPQGLAGIVQTLKKDYGMAVGLWHPTTGYWHGINPAGKLAQECRELLFMAPNGQLIHSFDRDKITAYYDRQHSFYHDCGVDFVKVDNQSCVRRYTALIMPCGEAADNLHHAIENAVDKYYGGQLINCMGQASENFWHRGHSAICRFSGDFQPENREWFITHLLQCSYNSMVQGTVYTGDWDMWWSDDGQATKNAVLRAMSGGPIYISDKLDRSIATTILPTVCADGRIIRLADPARPTEDCLFRDHRSSGGIYKVFNRYGGCGVLAAFNLDAGENPVCGEVSPADARLPHADRYCVYEWFSHKVCVLRENESFPLTLNNYDDFRLYHIAPVVNGQAVIGLKEKYMSCATFRQEDGRYVFSDDGTALVYDADADTLLEIPVQKGIEYAELC